ncbi:hypothetical protein [Pseudarthrobacter sp. YAF2]|uniref:hypothetical protein n=1 Tax=Pseudarthrobacter sp. YAF2 TaxID=3233078 RepID=UPI003F9746E2
MAECSWGDIGCGVGNALEDLANDAIGNLAKSIMEGMSQMVTTLSTFWASMPTVNLTSEDGAKASPVVSAVNSELMPWTLTLAVLAVIIGGIRMIWEQRGAPLKDLLRSLLTLTLVSAMGLGTISILVVAADAFASAIIKRSTDGKGFADAFQKIAAIQTGDAVFILIVLGLIGLIASLVQIVLMVVRSGMLVILAGILPTTAAFTNTEMGRQWFQKAVGWTIAFILYKPAAAIVYSVAFLLMSKTSGKDALIASITGFTLMIVALFALPALMRFVTPMVGAVAAGSGAAAGAAVGVLATGAVSMGRVGSGRGNAAPTPASTSTSTSTTTSTHTSDSPKGSSGSSGPRGGGGQPTPGSAGPGGAAGTAGKAGAAAPAGGAGTATGAAATGPAGLAVAAGVQVASRTSEAIKTTAQDSTGEGPSGSN